MTMGTSKIPITAHHSHGDPKNPRPLLQSILQTWGTHKSPSFFYISTTGTPKISINHMSDMGTPKIPVLHPTGQSFGQLKKSPSFFPHHDHGDPKTPRPLLQFILQAWRPQKSPSFFHISTMGTPKISITPYLICENPKNPRPSSTSQPWEPQKSPSLHITTMGTPKSPSLASVHASDMGTKIPRPSSTSQLWEPQNPQHCTPQPWEPQKSPLLHLSDMGAPKIPVL